jgi:2-dehydro-3-deoxyphosphogluconate aldolase / (4S)-4-hydroxy-2-oxoglutarate aldolase
MTRNEILATILHERVIAIIRVGRGADVLPVVAALREGGLRCMEVALTTPAALEAIEEVSARFPDILFGAGTVTTPGDVDSCARAGARFLVTPVMLPEIIPPAHALEMPVVMGAFTPTEIHAARTAGADLVKLFPASSLGPEYLRALRGPFPDVRVAPTGGVDVNNAREWLDAGAVALGIGGALTRAEAIRTGRFEQLTDHARALVRAIS